jgi:predicted ABC-type transport system involved in lysophospholipase L1 biosynthesis ATPase subunit
MTLSEETTAAVPPDVSTPDVVLACRDVRKSFAVGNRQLEVLHGVSLELRRGERLALMGSSGAGKSTLLHVLGLLDRPNEGEVYVEGKEGWGLSVAARSVLRNRRVGFVFQFYHLLPELDAVENVLLPAMIGRGFLRYRAERKELRAKAVDLLTSFGLADRLEHRPVQLSGGERQRVALARALLHDPPILIADEPTGNLDTHTGERVLELLFGEQERRGFSLLLVTHDERLARRCERVIYMRDGLIQGDTGTPIPS